MADAASKRIKKITLQVIKVDMTINWSLAVVFVFFPRFFQRLIASGEIFQIWLLQLIGIALIIFASWQVKILKRSEIAPGELVLLTLTTFIPAVLLATLLMMDFRLYSFVRLGLWAADIYMLTLGGWYLYVLKKLERES